LGIIATNDCENLFIDLIKSVNKTEERKVNEKLSFISNKNERISYLRAKVINALITKSNSLYQENFDNILNGSQDKALLDIFRTESSSFQEVERFSIERIYGHRSVVEIENAGYNVMYELLNHFIPPIILEKEHRKSYDKKALQLLPAQFIYENASVYERVLGVLDFVSGMTDNFATDLYRKIKGIDIGMTM
jgi:dGTPase